MAKPPSLYSEFITAARYWGDQIKRGLNRPDCEAFRETNLGKVPTFERKLIKILGRTKDKVLIVLSTTNDHHSEPLVTAARQALLIAPSSSITRPSSITNPDLLFSGIVGRWQMAIKMNISLGEVTVSENGSPMRILPLLKKW